MEGTRRVQEYVSVHGRRQLRVENGTVLVFSDSHYFPGINSTAHRAFLWACKQLRPSAVVNNGDSLDGASISRWPRIGWDSKPTVLQELQACTERLTEIEMAAGTRNLYWNLGNHDSRFETFLASKVPEFQGVSGFHLKDHFSLWLPSWSVWINEHVVVKHRMRGGIHATRNNALNAGKTVVTGHLHSLKVTPLSDYNGTRWGVDTGTLAQPYGAQFTDYTEDGVVDWRSGFVVLTFWNGTLLDPETVRVMDEERGLVVFRGQVITV
jgi:predicted phosphodiesterase